MERKLFEDFYCATVDVLANRIVSYEKKQTKNNQTRVEYHRNLDGVYEEYLNQRTLLRTVIKNSKLDAADEGEILLDGHKVAACLTCAIIKVRLLTSPQICDGGVKEDGAYKLDRAYRRNEQLALLCGLSCLFGFMAERPEHLYVDTNNHTKTDIIFPETFYPERSSYLDSLVRALFYSNTFSNINPLLLSHIYYQIDAFHRKCVEFKEYKRDHGGD